MTEISYENFSEKISKSKKLVGLIFYDGNKPEDLTYLDLLNNAIAPKSALYQTDFQKDGSIFASLYGVLSSPTLLLLQGGKETTRYSGFLKPEEINAIKIFIK